MSEEPVAQLRRLDLGSGPNPREGFEGVDIEPFTHHQLDFDTGEPWPFESDSVDELWSSHAIEHIAAAYVPEWEPVADLPNGANWTDRVIIRGGIAWRQTGKKKDALFQFFDEAFRVARPGATFRVMWPPLQNQMAFSDPTHRRFIGAGIVNYLSRELRAQTGVSQYRVRCNWVGVCSEIVPADAGGPEALQVRCQEMWNQSLHTVMTLVAIK